MGDRHDGAVEGRKPLLQRLGAVQVEVVGRLVEQQHRAAGQLQQQHLHAGLLATRQRVEDLVGLPVQLVAAQRPDRLCAVQAAAPVITAVQHLDQAPAVQGRLLVGLGEPARLDPGPEPPRTGVRDRLAGQQAQEVALTAAVGAEDREPLAVEHLEVEGLHQPGQLEPGAGQGPHTGAPAPQPHLDLLVHDLLRRRSGLQVLGQPGLHRGELGRHRVAHLGLHPQRDDQLAQPLPLLLPPLVQLVEPVTAGLARRGVGREATAVHPGAVRLDGHDAVRGAGQQLAVVADEQHGLLGLGQRRLEPALARHVEVVVGLVEQQDLVGAAQQRLQREPLLLATGERGQRAELRLLVRHPQRGRGAHVPDDLGVVAVGVAPVRQRGGVAHLGRGVVVLHHGQLGGLQGPPGRLEAGRGEVDEQVAHGGVVADRADELPHHAQAAGAGDLTRRRREVAGDHPQQRGLARPVGADERGLGAVADPEAHLVEQHPPVRQDAGELLDVDVTHGDQCDGAVQQE